jgi:hypothetical protein
MTDDLINLNELGIAQPSEEQEKALSELTQAGDYLPQLRVFGSESGIVKEGLFPMGHFGLYFQKDKILDLTEQVDVVVVAYRPRASIMMSDDQPINYFDHTTDNFNDVTSKAKAKVQGYLAGLEYMLWIPSVNHFAIFFMGNTTLRRESSNVKARVGKAATLKIKLIKSKQYTWHGCETLGCDAPLEVPPPEQIKEVYDTKFANPKDSEVDVAGAGEDEARAR